MYLTRLCPPLLAQLLERGRHLGVSLECSKARLPLRITAGGIVSTELHLDLNFMSYAQNGC